MQNQLMEIQHYSVEHTLPISPGRTSYHCCFSVVSELRISQLFRVVLQRADLSY